MADVGRERVDLWMDPLCPWSWLTAEWLLEVQAQSVRAGTGAVEIEWHVMSLSILNDGPDLPEEWRDFVRIAWGPVRVLEAGRQVDPESFVPLMRAIARRWHVESRRDIDAVLVESVGEVGLPPTVAEAAWTDGLDEDVRLSHKQAMALGGEDVGSPILSFVRTDGEVVGHYGPILSRVPRGEEAVRVFGAVRTLATTPGFFELKRTRDEEPWLE